MTDSDDEIVRGERFAFGANWSRFLESLNDERIERAESTLRDMLEVDSLHGMRFLDIGSGSGLFSLAARRLGAIVHSLDYDRKSVACTTELKRRFFLNDPDWVVEQGSVLNIDNLQRLGQWDIVYSWGVLHHTGAMRQALQNVVPLVAPQGRLFISIYNDQGYISQRWAWIKRNYNRHPWMRPFLLAYGFARAWGMTMMLDLLHLHPFVSWRRYHEERGMSPWWDIVDWIGGWPFEVATPEAIFRFYRDRGFTLQNMITRQGYGCNEFVFGKS